MIVAKRMKHVNTPRRGALHAPSPGSQRRTAVRLYWLD